MAETPGIDHAVAPVRAPPRHWLRRLGAGLITGAADDDPSGIATYSQAGAQFGYTTLWTTLFTLPLMIGIQTICAHVGRVTGRGLAANMRLHFPQPLVLVLVSLLLLANIINLAADIGAMGAALTLLVGGPSALYALGFALLSLALEVVIPFPRYAPLLKLLTLSLFAYVLTVLVIDVPWREVATQWWPSRQSGHNYLVTVVAVFGTTISPYLFFWQASQEAEEEESAADQSPLEAAPEQASAAFERIRFDTDIGMFYSNVVAFFIMLTTAVVLHPHGITDINTSAEAAQALRPLAGRFASLLFAAGIVGTGLLAVPILAGSAAYAVAETFDRQSGLGRKPADAKLFYLIIIGATVLGTLLSLSPMDPIRMLFWSAVINGVISVPLMVGIMWVATHRAVMGRFAIDGALRWLGWLATAAMAMVVIGTLL
ncbi:NRAMP (natural resistance-associated macrophage protein) metal ion transporters [Dyella sp. OK004]|uniref:NRAMP family divalent metal transporter n=1 Tax=Dyella sp. OK004 TaxID=1855292 RepID=UPI0008E51604|nr:divalent metal cation transporter [Dyella sp. OK004]SFS13911.1 NRAMP (natural resistance-associated macrophage protein) metal ion transporters [Dyella sp. OK004]